MNRKISAHNHIYIGLSHIIVLSALVPSTKAEIFNLTRYYFECTAQKFDEKAFYQILNRIISRKVIEGAGDNRQSFYYLPKIYMRREFDGLLRRLKFVSESLLQKKVAELLTPLHPALHHRIQIQNSLNQIVSLIEQHRDFSILCSVADLLKNYATSASSASSLVKKIQDIYSQVSEKYLKSSKTVYFLPNWINWNFSGLGNVRLGKLENPTVPQRIHFIEFKMSEYQPKVSFLSTYKDPDAGLDRHVLREQALFGINGGYFVFGEIAKHDKLGTPIGLVHVNGKTLFPPIHPRAAILVNQKNEIFFDVISLMQTELWINHSHQLKWHVVNRFSANPKEPVVLTKAFRQDFGLFKDYYFALFIGDELKEIYRPGLKGEIPYSGLMIGIHKKYFNPELFLRENYFEFKVNFPRKYGQVVDAMASGPMLIDAYNQTYRQSFALEEFYKDTAPLNFPSINFDREEFWPELAPTTFTADRDLKENPMPRSAIAVTGDNKVILLVADGRQKTSRGITFREMTQILTDMGAVRALNLDPGGSATLCLKGKIINQPSVGAEGMFFTRSIPTAIVFKALK